MCSTLETFLERYGFKLASVWRMPASFYYLVLKFRFRYGAWSSLGLVRMAKTRKQNTMQGTPSAAGLPIPPLYTIATLAKMKDILLFGIPAGILWLVLLPTRARYTDFYVVAEPR